MLSVHHGMRLFLSALALVAFQVSAQVETAWVRDGATNGSGWRSRLVLDSDEVFAAGDVSSGYATTKYDAAGKQQWIDLISATETYLPLGLASAGNGEVVVTGTFGTIKYNASGKALWVAK